jgi:two-component system, chemotaxis family, protein-glutamate methylesterase/glutaminase
MSEYDAVVIGASWGGLHAMEFLLSDLPGDFPAPIAVAQHRDADAEDHLLPKLLARHTPLEVRDADHDDVLRPGSVLLAPPGYHMLIEGGRVNLSVDEPVQFARPSIDVLFESAAETFGDRLIGVVLTGANADGAAGLAAIAHRGGHTIVQDPATAERPEMPRAALAAKPDQILRLEAIGPALCSALAVEAA